MTTNNPPTKGVSPRALNNLKNGARIHRLALGELPKQLSRVTRYCRGYRVALEAAVAEAHGDSVSVSRAHLIDAACGHEQHCQIMRWLLREKLDTMTVADIVKCSTSMAMARDARNRAVSALDLDRDRLADSIDALYSTPEKEGGDDAKAD